MHFPCIRSVWSSATDLPSIINHTCSLRLLIKLIAECKKPFLVLKDQKKFFTLCNQNVEHTT